MNKLLLSCRISRAVRVQRPVTCYRLLNKSFSITTCRKSEEKNPSLPAETDVVQDDTIFRELLWAIKTFI